MPGRARVARRTVRDLIRNAARSVCGVTGLAGGGPRPPVLDWLSVPHPGLRLAMGGTHSFELDLTVADGLKVAEVARQVASMTDREVVICAIQTMQVTEAVRAATMTCRKVKKGQTMALDQDDELLAVDNDPHRSVSPALTPFDAGYSLLTTYHGEDTTLADAEALGRRIRAAAPGVDIEIVHGGQPHYRYLVSAE